MSDLTTFIIPSIDRPTLQRAIDSVKGHPYLVEIDRQHVGPSATRNGLIKLADTPWVSMLDDDDTVTPDYVDRLRDELKVNPEADVVIFREFFPHGVVLPAWPVVAMGNIPISFSIKRELALRYPFLDEPHEDFELIARLERAGAHIHFSQWLTYRMRH